MRNKVLIDEAINEISKSKKVYIISHINPDGDNLGSSLALYLGLKQLKDSVYIIKNDIIPKDFLFLPNIDDMIEEVDYRELELLIVLDCSDEKRLGKYEDIIENARKVINIDHHISNTNFGHINIVDFYAAATGQIIYKFINTINSELINKNIATCLYTAISSDTGSFMYDNTTSETHRIVADLIDKGIDKNHVNINLYQNRSLNKTMLFIKALENLTTYFNNQVGIVKITEEILDDTNTTMEDSEGIISFIREIDTIEVAIVMKEIDVNEIKVSMRSKSYIDVADICSKLGGGGHIRAAGCTIKASVDEAKDLILQELRKNFR